MQKRIALRFDIDSIACVNSGLPGLMSLGRRLGIPMTFFVTMGSPILRTALLSKHGSARHGARQKLSPLAKLGARAFIQTLLFNRKIGVSCADTLARLLKENHELGLHGGKNHAWWQRYAPSAGADELREDLSWGYDAFVKYFGVPAGFAAPGFVWNNNTLDCIEEKHFLYASDMDGAFPFKPDAGGRRYDHWQLPVTIAGPERIPYMEWSFAQKKTLHEIIEGFEKRLIGDYAVLYGHPCWAGTRGLPVLEELVRNAIDKGYTFSRMKDMVPPNGQTAHEDPL